MDGMDIGAQATGLLTERNAAADPSAMRSIERDGEPSAPDAALVKEILAKIEVWKKHHEKAFERMRRDVRFATDKHGAQWDGTNASPDTNSYVANITHRHIQMRTGVLYAKNPRVKAGRRKRLDAVLWDGTPEMLNQAMQVMQQAGANAAAGQVDPSLDVEGAKQVIAEVLSIKQHRAMIDKIGLTAELVYHYYMNEGEPRFKARAKAWVRRAVTTGVSWLKLDFQREREYTPPTVAKIADFTTELNHLESELEKVADGETFEGSARIAEIKAQLDKLQAEPTVIKREGLVFDFPKSWRVILDDQCSQLTGLVDCMGLAQEMPLTQDEVREAFKVDLKGKFTVHKGIDKNGKQRDEALLYEHYDRKTGLMCVVCTGYPDFIVRPGAPRVKIERFFPFYPLCFNESECEEGEIYPPSDVELMAPMQREYNRSREALRQHRIASTPGYVANAGAFSNEEDVKKMGSRVAHEVLMLKGFPTDKPISNVIQAIPVEKIDQNVYMVDHVFQDLQRTTGDQEANLGGTAGGTATESSIAENSRMSTVASNIDDLDGVLTEVARDGSQVLLMELDQETAKRIAGKGAVWPQLDRETIAAELFLEIVAGSSGRPNRDRDAANFERIMPLLSQVPGINPMWLAKHGVQLMDETVDLEDALLEGIPSLTAMNAAIKNVQSGAAPGGEATGDPRTDPTLQGGEGGDNAPGPAQADGGSAPGYTPPNAAPVGV